MNRKNTQMIQVWGRKTSSNVQALLWCIGELGLDYVRYDIGHKYGGNQSAEFVSMNPNKTVPVLQDGDGFPLWETAAILRYLASKYANEQFWPTDQQARSQVDMWAEWAKINIALSFTAPIFWRVVRTAEKDRDAAAIAQALANFEQKLQIAEQQLQGKKYLLGSQLTLADIQFGHLLYRYYDIDIERAVLPELAAYYARLETRPAFVEHVMVSYEDLRVI